MKTHRVSIPGSLFLLAVSVLLAGCSPAITPEQYRAQLEKWEAQRDTLEPRRNAIDYQSVSARNAREAARARAAEMVTARFVGVDERGRARFELRNVSGRTIEDVAGGLHVETRNGQVVFVSTVREDDPTEPFLRPGQSREQAPYGLERRPRIVESLHRHPDDFVVWFEVSDVTFGDPSLSAKLELVE